MTFTLTMPKLSPTMEEGTITKWHKKVGDFVHSGDVIFEVATDKATVEHTALDEGYLRKILVDQGQSAIVNQAIAILTQKQEESIENYTPEGITPVKTPIEKSHSSSPQISSSHPSPPSVELNQPAFVPEAPSSHTFKRSSHTNYGIAASPLAKKLAKQKGIDLSTIKGSGPNQRIVSKDLELGQPNTPVTFGRQEAPTMLSGEFTEESLSPMRKVISQRLQAAKSFIPHFYVSLDVRAKQLLQTRTQLSAIGLKISVNDFVVRASALALREHPEVNSGFNSVNQTIIRFKTIDISIAVAVEEGLITPIVRYADYKNLGELSTEIRHLAHQAKEGKLQREDYAGGSFTISNLGMYGVSSFSAIINPPQAAILAIAAVEDRPVIENDSIKPGKVMTLTLSSDHRVLDGVIAARFLKTIQKYLENPASLLV